MRLRRTASLLIASALAVAVSTGVAGVAHASAAPVPGGLYELWPPYANPVNHKCLDVPGGSTSVGVRLQIFHCHGSDSHGDVQLFQFVYVGNNKYWIINQHSSACVGDGIFGADSFYYGTPAVQVNCLPAAGYEWEIVPSALDPNGFMLRSDGVCMGVLAGSDHTVTEMINCDNSPYLTSGVQADTWELG
jgi:hypothetical protein